MVTVRWVTQTEAAKPANTRDQHFNTKNEALAAINKTKVSSIKRLYLPHRTYIVVPTK